MHYWPPVDSIGEDQAGSLNLAAYGSPTFGEGVGPGGVDVVNFSDGNVLRATSVNPFGINDGFALECYVKPTGTPSNNSGFIISHQSGSDKLANLYWTAPPNPDFRFRLYDIDDDYVTAAGGVATLNVWHHVIALFIGGQLELWVNGALVDVQEWTEGTFQTASGAFSLGGLANAPGIGYDFIGQGYGFRVYV